VLLFGIGMHRWDLRLATSPNATEGGSQCKPSLISPPYITWEESHPNVEPR